jgi:hypothetical protein
VTVVPLPLSASRAATISSSCDVIEDGGFGETGERVPQLSQDLPGAAGTVQRSCTARCVPAVARATGQPWRAGCGLLPRRGHHCQRRGCGNVVAAHPEVVHVSVKARLEHYFQSGSPRSAHYTTRILSIPAQIGPLHPKINRPIIRDGVPAVFRPVGRRTDDGQRLEFERKRRAI